MVGRQLRNLMREPIWIALLLVQPMVWLLLYGQLFKRVTHLPGGGFGTTSYITFLAPAIVIMNSFFGATWSGMAMISDLDRDVLPRFLATPVSRISLVVSQIVRSSLIAVIQGAIILLVSLALGVRVHSGLVGWVVVLIAAALMNAAFAGLSQGIALLVRKEATMIAIANFIGLPLLFLSPIAGTATDRYGRKTQLIVAQLLNIPPALILGILVLTHRVEPWHVYASGLAASIFSTIRHTRPTSSCAASKAWCRRRSSMRSTSSSRPCTASAR